MNKNLNDDAPLFNKTQEGSSGSDRLALEKVKQDSRKFSKLISIGTKSIRWIVIFAMVLIVIDGIYQKMGIDNSLLKDCFSLVKYSLTTILGFVFANNSSKSS